jgi:Flp pilus assembly protein TadG
MSQPAPTVIAPRQGPGLLTAHCPRRRLRTAQALLEFVILLPFLIFIMVFTVDLGRLIFTGNALQDAVYASARTGAQAGGACVTACPNSSAQQTFNHVIAGIPTSSPPAGVTWSVVNGSLCSATGANSNVTVKGTYPINFITPGLGTVLKGFFNNVPTISAIGTARCEVSR